MEYREIPGTELTISRIALGTVELGMDYGFLGSDHRRRPDTAEAIRTIHKSLDLGINLIDTAPTYGSSQEVIGQALRGMYKKPLIASKVTIPESALAPEARKQLASTVLRTVEASLTALKIERLDLLQLHNTSIFLLTRDEVLRALEDACSQGKVRFLGASCVGENVSRAALATMRFHVLQLPFNLLDRQMIAGVFPQARHQGTGILARSAFLRGVLTDNLKDVPESLSALKDAAQKLFRECAEEAGSLSELALRFNLSFEAISSVIIGVRSVAELESNIAAAAQGPLSKECLRRLSEVSVEDPSMVNPETWIGLV